jgi:peptidyl-prolyl cis-trans isomerase SurA
MNLCGRFFVFLFLSMFVILKDIKAEDVEILAEVNGSIITSYELDKRVQFQRSLSDQFKKIPLKQFKKIVLEGMISDKIKLKELSLYNVSVDPKELKNSIRGIEARNGLPKGSFDKIANDVGIDKDNAYEQIRTEIAWGKFIRSFYFHSVDIDEKDVDAIYKDTVRKHDVYASKYKLSQIIYPKGKVSEMFNTLRRKKFTCSGFNKHVEERGVIGSGELGVVTVKDLRPNVISALEGVKKGELTNPINDVDGTFVSYYVCEKAARKGAEKLPKDLRDRIKFSQLGKKMELFSEMHYEKLKDNAVVVYY